MVNLDKETPAANEETDDGSILTARYRPARITRICPECRFYALSWLAFLCGMGWVIVNAALLIAGVSEESGIVASIVTAVICITVYFVLAPSTRRKADEEFADMGYRDHIHI